MIEWRSKRHPPIKKTLFWEKLFTHLIKTPRNVAIVRIIQWGKRSKTNIFAKNVSYRLPTLKTINSMTNIITAVMSNVFSMPTTIFFLSINYCFFFNSLCRPITFANDNIIPSQ